jgi:hypothetical protein
MIRLMPRILNAFLKIPARVFVGLFIVSSLICIFSLRHNNQQMVTLRDAVYAADKDNKDVNTALNNLAAYVYVHMNTNLSSGGNNIKPPIQLKYTYQRLYDAQLNKFQTANQTIYAEAQNYCQSIGNAAYLTGLSCVENYIVNHGYKGANVNIPVGLYQYDFYSPAWSPDLAGWSMVTSVMLFIASVLRLGLSRLPK